MTYGDRFERALIYAARLHREQKRKTTDIPYVTHLLAVASLVGEAGGSEDAVIAALLHDAVEDQGGQKVLEDIRQQFGDRVGDIVWECTDADQMPKPPWRERKEAYIRHLAHALPESRLVSCADKLHNARSIVADLHIQGKASFDKFKGGLEGTLWYYRAICNTLAQQSEEQLAGVSES